MRVNGHAGFTLIELMVVVGIIAIVAAIALPSYKTQVLKGRRAEAINGLGELQLRQERWRAENPEFATVAQLGIMPTSSYYGFTSTIPAGSCSDGTTACTATNCYAVTADTAGAQTDDDGTCATLTLESRCGEVSKTSTPSGTGCWGR
jgi:type IV pilus assembly protein PilE